MAKIGFIGLGNMGGPMVNNLLRAGHDLKVFDVVPEAMERAVGQGAAAAAGDVADAAQGVEVVITLLPAGEHVRQVYLGPDGVIAAADDGALLLDCSTIDVESARVVATAAAEASFEMLDAPVSGGVGGAEAGTLTFMVGGPDTAFERAKPYLEVMGGNIVHTGGAGNGQAAKICNNMILGVSMIGVAEAFVMAEKLGLDAQKLFDVTSTSSGQCWAITSYCPVPGPVPASPANRDFQAGFTAAMMHKDLRLAQDAAKTTGVATAMGAGAAALYALYCNSGNEGLDFSGIIDMIRGRI
jgi:3-hydroxyisobutyrate dehydrogenase